MYLSPTIEDSHDDVDELELEASGMGTAGAEGGVASCTRVSGMF